MKCAICGQSRLVFERTEELTSSGNGGACTTPFLVFRCESEKGQCSGGETRVFVAADGEVAAIWRKAGEGERER